MALMTTQVKHGVNEAKAVMVPETEQEIKESDPKTEQETEPVTVPKTVTVLMVVTVVVKNGERNKIKGTLFKSLLGMK